MSIENDHDEALEALNDLSHLASGIGHHVINAFSAIVSSSEILRLKLARPAPVDPAILADMIINTSLEAAAVARRLIDYTRPITSIGEDRLALDRLVADYVREREQDPSVPAGITWTTDLAPIPPIRGHAPHLRSMLDHFLANSYEAMEAADNRKEIALATSVDSRGWVVLEIRDTGRGMTPEVQERAVEPFFTTKNGHIGVGLSIGNGIWRRHKGTLALRGIPGEGTTLRLCVEP